MKTTTAETGVLVNETNSQKKKRLSSSTIGNISKEVELFVLPCHLSYISLGLPHCTEFELTIGCINCILLQNNHRLVRNSFKKSKPQTFHINNENNLKKI